MLDIPTIQYDELSSRTRTLAAKYYISDDILAAEKKRLFFKNWLFACHASELDEVGAYRTLSIFDQNLFLVRTKEGEIKGFYNVCPHRGHMLLEGQGQKRGITCPYHAWTYSLDGQLIGARGLKSASGVNKSDICLSSVRVDQVLDLIFVNLDPNAPPLNEFAPGLSEQLLSACPDILSYRPAHNNNEELGHTYLCEANWKVMIDNYLECYHCENAHRTFSDMMDIPSSRFTLHQNYTFQVAPTAMKAENQAFPLNLEHDVTVGHFWFLFPNTVFGQFPGVPGFYISRFDPLTPDRTSRVTTTLIPEQMPDPDAARRDRLRAEWTVNVVAVEDQALCENVQRGMHQMGFQQGYYITDPHAHNISEHAMRYFHDLYLQAMHPNHVILRNGD